MNHTVIEDDQQRRQQVTHALNVANVKVLPDIADRTKDNIAIT